MSGNGSFKILTKLQSLWLIPIVLMFFVSATISLIQLKHSINILDSRYGTSVWALFQLKSEFYRFHDALRVYRHNPDALDDVQERYEILWSRFPLTLKGTDGEQISKIDGASELIQTSFSNIQALEPLIYQQPPLKPELSDDIRAKLTPDLLAVDKLALDNYHFNNDFFNRGDREVAKLQEQLIWLMVGLIISGCLLLLRLFHENQINRFQAEHDSLTGMPNRAYLRQQLSNLCSRGRPFALHLIDLNGFKDINDSLGHHTGDLVLQAVATRLTGQVDKHYQCVTCRLGGDEFAIIQSSVHNQNTLTHVADRIIKLLEEPVAVENHQCHIGASIGSSCYPEHGRDGSTLMSHADIAMYKAKGKAPESSQQLFNYTMIEQINRRQQLQKDLRTAIESNALHLEYQPIIDLKSGNIHSLEALLRWNHPLFGAVPPLEVIATAEQYGLTKQFGHWLIFEVAAQLKAWESAGFVNTPVSINVCPSMYQMDLAELINSALTTLNLTKGLIWIEVTEDTTMQIIRQAKGLLPELNKHGIRIALDDFGTGLSSLSHLQKLPIQTLKIDRSFVSNLNKNTSSKALVKHIIAIGHDLGLSVVAEGIEEEATALQLEEMACDYAQGYFFSRPALASHILELSDTIKARTGV